MNTIRPLLILTMIAAVASAAEPDTCHSSLTMNEVITAMGTGVAAQPVFALGTVKGWRLYNVRHSAQLMAHGVPTGTMMTHVCGVPAQEIRAAGWNVCCNVDVSREVEVTFQIAEQETKVLIKRQP
jgi:hypothetical protein